MQYSSIFDTRPIAQNKLAFCKRVSKLLNDIHFKVDGRFHQDGNIMLNEMFMRSKLNRGYSSIDDMLEESGKGYRNIFCLTNVLNESISSEEILVNIDIITNLITSFVTKPMCGYFNEADAINNLLLVMKASETYLLDCGYKLVENDGKFSILDNNIAIDLEKLEDKGLKEDIITFYDYKNEKNIKEKKKIIVHVATIIESKKARIEEVMSKKLADTIFNYVNNINLRHDNVSPELRARYNKSVANLTEKELIQWYDFIFAIIMNVYINVDVLSTVNINDGYI